MPIFYSITRATHGMLCEQIKEVDTGDKIVDAGLYLLAFPIVFVKNIPPWFVLNLAVACCMSKIPGSAVAWLIKHSFSKRAVAAFKNEVERVIAELDQVETKIRWDKAHQQQAS